MNIRLMLATTVAACTLVATSAYAGSPYYADTNPDSPATVRTSSLPRGDMPADREYRATAADNLLEGAAAVPAAAASTATSTTAGVLGPDGYLPIQPSSQFYNHAAGTMGAP